jgi:anti-sigma-K factor RskA
VSAREDPHLLSGAYALDAVTPEEATDMERAMDASEDLRSEVAELTDTAVLLGLSVAPAEPSPDLRARLLAGIETTPQLPPLQEQESPEDSLQRMSLHVAPRQAGGSARAVRAGAGSAPRGRGASGRAWARRPGTLLAAVAAAAVLLFGAGVLVDNLVRPSSSSTQALTWTQITSASDAHHRSAPVAGGGTVAVYWSTKLGASAVKVQGAAPPSGKSMQLWRMEDGKATSAGLWHPPAGQDYQVLKGAMHKGQTFGITVEPAGGSPQPTTTPVVAIPIT